MTKYKDTFRIESSRLKGWDYSNPWWYYVTVTTRNHVEHFGKVVKGRMKLNDLGMIAEKYWNEIPNHFKNVELDCYVIMPNHLHGIIIINEQRRDVACNVSTMNKYAPISPKTNSLSVIVRSFKSAGTKQIHELGYLNFYWQSRFYDRIIRNEKEVYNIRNYIEHNPLKWELEKDKPENIFEL
ncbi:MAG: transposase [Bacteroidota bacterium]